MKKENLRKKVELKQQKRLTIRKKRFILIKQMEKKVKLKVYRVRKDAKLPVRSHRTDAGMDLFFCPEDNKGTILCSQHTKLFQTGLKFEVPEDYMLEIKNKSSIASKQQLVVGACVVDSGYDGEVFVNLHNIGLDSQYLEPGQKIAQAVLIPVSYCEIDEVVNDNLNKSSTRGEGALGSTGDR